MRDLPSPLGLSHRRGPGVLDRAARALVIRRLSGLKRGEIALEDFAGVDRFGQPADLFAKIRVQGAPFYRRAVLGGTLGVAESYLRGEWECDDLTSLIRIFIRNAAAAERLDGGWARLANFGRLVGHWLRRNTRRGSRQNIREHYDLGNDFFRLWLDETMAYSSGIFPSPAATLREASTEKFDRACRKLDLKPDDRVLEIGSGWGGMALHMAREYGCRVVTTTISREQHAAVCEQVEAQGLANRIQVVQLDYRDLAGEFDKLVSIEMIEAVGSRYFDTFFRQCGRLLRANGTLLLQAIVMPEGRYGPYLRSVDFIRRYVFPGGCLPSLGAMLESAGRATDLRFVHAEDFAPHYAETLRRWRQAFEANRNEIGQLGYGERLLRMWSYYLSYCEAAFEERYVGVIQVQFDKPECRRDPLRLSQRAAKPRQWAENHARAVS